MPLSITILHHSGWSQRHGMCQLLRLLLCIIQTAVKEYVCLQGLGHHLTINHLLTAKALWLQAPAPQRRRPQVLAPLQQQPWGLAQAQAQGQAQPFWRAQALAREPALGLWLGLPVRAAANALLGSFLVFSPGQRLLGRAARQPALVLA